MAIIAVRHTDSSSTPIIIHTRVFFIYGSPNNEISIKIVISVYKKIHFSVNTIWAFGLFLNIILFKINIKL